MMVPFALRESKFNEAWTEHEEVKKICTKIDKVLDDAIARGLPNVWVPYKISRPDQTESLRWTMETSEMLFYYTMVVRGVLKSLLDAGYPRMCIQIFT